VFPGSAEALGVVRK